MAASRRLALKVVAAAAALLAAGTTRAADLPSQLTLDWAYYNPVSLVLKQEGWLEEELKADGIEVRWVQSLGSNKALEFLNAGSLDFGSTAGAAALLAKINGNPIQIRLGLLQAGVDGAGHPARHRHRQGRGSARASGSRSPRAPTPTSSCCARWTSTA